MTACIACGQEVDWVTAVMAADLLDLTPARIRQLIRDGRLAGAVKYHPPGGINPFYKIPAASVINFMRLREDDE